MSANRLPEQGSNNYAYRAMFPRLIKRMRSIATAAYVQAT